MVTINVQRNKRNTEKRKSRKNIKTINIRKLDKKLIEQRKLIELASTIELLD